MHPEHRGRGLGLTTWRQTVPHAGERTIGLDAVPAQEATYRRSGFAAAHRTVRYGGRPAPDGGPLPAGTRIVPVTPEHAEAVAAYDRECFPADRAAFVGRWATAAGHTARAAVRDGRLTGYGVIRAARDGHRVVPLPEHNTAAHALAEERKLTPSFETVRMYTGPVPPSRSARVFGVTSLELG